MSDLTATLRTARNHLSDALKKLEAETSDHAGLIRKSLKQAKFHADMALLVAQDASQTPAQRKCDHVFRDSTGCLRCGWEP